MCTKPLCYERNHSKFENRSVKPAGVLRNYKKCRGEYTKRTSTFWNFREILLKRYGTISDIQNLK